MSSKISGGVSIMVDTFYQSEYSDPKNNEFIFAYKITIHNTNVFPVRLLRRKWRIIDSNGAIREVEGEGVVGVQPQIAPGSHYQYISACHLKSELGKMQGSYQLENVVTKKTFQVAIPEFSLEAPFKLN